MSYEAVGKLLKKYDTEQKSQTFQAREFVLEVVDGQYPQFIKFQLTQDRCSLLDPFEEGAEMKVHFDLRGREWNGKQDGCKGAIGCSPFPKHTKY
ncbi:MAG: DUF3127 domain-containing protein, partial [Bacteroidota bacterium]